MVYCCSDFIILNTLHHYDYAIMSIDINLRTNHNEFVMVLLHFFNFTYINKNILRFFTNAFIAMVDGVSGSILRAGKVL